MSQPEQPLDEEISQPERLLDVKMWYPERPTLDVESDGDDYDYLLQTEDSMDSVDLEFMKEIAAINLQNMDENIVYDYMYRLIPDLLQILNSSFYWGKLDRTEADKMMETQSVGTYLLRDSGHEKNLFTLSFRMFEKTMHTRMEQWHHYFNFDVTGPGEIASSTVCGLIEKYKKIISSLLFKPLLITPLRRNFILPLQNMCRGMICSRLLYHDIDELDLPMPLKLYLKEYHYKERIKIESIDPDYPN